MVYSAAALVRVSPPAVSLVVQRGSHVASLGEYHEGDFEFRERSGEG
jgi:hypothetical protein